MVGGVYQTLTFLSMNVKVLYLRTVYWFDIASGGSIGHTSGVVNSLDKVTKLTVISNDQLVGVKRSVKILKPIRIPFLLSEYNELIYSIILKRRLRSFIGINDIIRYIVIIALSYDHSGIIII